MLDGLKRIVNSAKVQLAAIAATGAVVTYVCTPGTTAEKRGLLQTVLSLIFAMVGACILAWAHEDAALKSTPQQQVNVGGTVQNNPGPGNPPAAAEAHQDPPYERLTDAPPPRDWPKGT